MFQSNMKENESGTVEIEDIQQEVVSELLQYIYCFWAGFEFLFIFVHKAMKVEGRMELSSYKFSIFRMQL